MGAYAGKNRRRGWAVIVALGAITVLLCAASLFIGSSRMPVADALAALAKRGTAANNRILWSIRIPRILAAMIAGAGLSASGLIMQTTLNNAMASPSTLGVSNAAVFGNNLKNYAVGANPYATGVMAFLFSVLSILLILGLCRVRAFSPNVVVLAGIAVGSLWTAATTILQFYATDVGISAAVIWSFGDLGRATYRTDWIMLAVVATGLAVFSLLAWRYNALLSGEAAAKTMGVNVELLRFASMLLASMITAVCVSFLGVIGFVGVICPHVAKRLLGQDHRVALPVSALCGSILLLAADNLSRSIGNGSALPVGAITSLLGAPFFVAILFSRKENRPC